MGVEVGWGNWCSLSSILSTHSTPNSQLTTHFLMLSSVNTVPIIARNAIAEPTLRPAKAILRTLNIIQAKINMILISNMPNFALNLFIAFNYWVKHTVKHIDFIIINSSFIYLSLMVSQKLAVEIIQQTLFHDLFHNYLIFVNAQSI